MKLLIQQKILRLSLKMYSLKGKTILIGREIGTARLLVAIDGIGKSVAIGSPGCVPNSVSHCDPAKGKAHAKIMVDQNGSMIVRNSNPLNTTLVNDTEIISKRISISDTLKLGKSMFRIELNSVIDAACKLVGTVPPPPKEQINIKHLEEVWNSLQLQRRQIQDRQKRINLIRTGCGIFTMCAMPCCFLFGPIGYVLTGIGIIGNIYSFFGLKNDNTADKLDHLNEDFQDNYVCPNCGKFLGNISYKLLKKQYSMHCPYCKCEYVEK